MIWWDFGEAGWVLELERPAVELHWAVVKGRSVAWWMDEWGQWLGRARVGVA